jgi:PAS domain S-box-containing protein
MELENLEDLIVSCEKYENVKGLPLAEIYDNINYGITIFKPIPEENDFLFIYSNPIFWDYFKPNFHKEIIGKLFKHVFPKFYKDFNQKFNFNDLDDNLRKDAVIKLYEDDVLLKIWYQKNIMQEGLIYSCLEDKTDFYKEKTEKDTIFEYSLNPIFNLNSQGEVTAINKSFTEFFGYTIEELNSKGLDKFVSTFNSENSNIKSFTGIVKFIFDNKVSFLDSKVGLTSKNGDYKWINAHLTWVNPDLVQVSIEDLSELRKSKKINNDLSKYLTALERASKTSFNIRDNEGFHWTNEIFDILEVDYKDRIYDTKNNYIYNYATDEGISKIEEALTRITMTNPVSVDYEVKTAKGKTKFLRAFLKLQEHEDQILRLGFTQDVTEETLSSMEALDLKESIDGIQEVSKIVVGTLQEGEYNFTSEIYNILGVSPDEYSNTDLLSFVLPEDQVMINDAVSNVSPDNPTFQYVFRFKTPNGEIKHMNTFNKATFDENGDLLKVIGFQQDITDKVMAKDEALRLTENFNIIQESSKIFLAEYENEEYSYTDEIYNILKINSENYPSNVNLLETFVLPEDKQDLESFKDVSHNFPEHFIKFRVRTSEGEIRYLLGHSKALFDDKGDLVRVIAFVQDVTDEEIIKKEEKRLKDNFDLIQESNKVFLAEFEDGKYRFTNELYNRLGIKKEDFVDTVNIVPLHLVPEDKDDWFNAMDLTPDNSVLQVTYRLKSQNGELIYIFCTNKAKFDENGHLLKIIGLLLDVTEEKLALKSATELGENLETIQKTSKVIISTFENGVHNFSNEIYNILEINPEDYPDGVDLIKMFATLESKNEFYSKSKNISPENNNLNGFTTVILPSGKTKVLEYYLVAKFNDKNEIIRYVTFLHDVTGMIEREKELEKLLEDRKILLQEVHHRVKNNLQIITSFLNLESRFNKDNPEYVIEQTRNRINTMALVHEEVYQSPSVSNINIENFLTKGMENLFNLYTNGKVCLNLNIDSIMVDIDVGIPLGLLINELALNTIKYAFPKDGRGNFFISLKTCENNLVVLKIWDDGVGLPVGVDLFTSNSLGFVIIRNLTQQLEADLKVLDDVSGFGVELRFVND